MNIFTSALVLFIAGFLLVTPPACAQQDPGGLAMPGTAIVSDAIAFQSPSQVHLGGLLGRRYSASEESRLLKIDEDELLSGFRQRPGPHSWMGEHIGKWLHAASLTYACGGAPELRAKMDRVATELMKTQEPDGYLGTYLPDQRFGFYPNADWDVWVHKYDLIGLLAYYQFTGNKDALETCKRIGDLLINTFGPGKANIVDSGWHYGLAPTSVLEPIVLLYRATGDKRYLSFADYIVTSWDEGERPRLLSGLLKGETVNIAGGGKAYEQTSCLIGLCELYRVTGRKQYLTAVLNAWNDIARNRLYITGSGSNHELWPADNDFPNDEESRICETCVTVTWMQLNMELLRLLGESRFADEIEKSLYNHLLAAQKPTGDDWCGYTPLEGCKRPYSYTSCCHSSGPRALALLPTLVYTTDGDGVTVNLFTDSKAVVPLPTGGNVELKQSASYPLSGQVKLTVTPTGISRPFAIRLRVPTWSPRVSVAVNGQAYSTPVTSGFVTLKRHWQKGDVVTYKIDMAPRIVLGDHGNAGRMAVMYGPLVLAADLTHNSLDGGTLANIAPAVDDPARFKLRRSKTQKNEDVPLFVTDAITLAPAAAAPSRCKLFLTPYYAVGADLSPFTVWMKRTSTLTGAH